MHRVAGENTEPGSSLLHSKSNPACFLSERDYSLKAGCCKHNPKRCPSKKQSEPCIPGILVRHARVRETPGGLSPITQYLLSFKPPFKSYLPLNASPNYISPHNFFLLWTLTMTSLKLTVALDHTPVLFHIKIMCLLFQEWFYAFWRLKKEIIL